MIMSVIVEWYNDVIDDNVCHRRRIMRFVLIISAIVEWYNDVFDENPRFTSSNGRMVLLMKISLSLR